VFGSQDTAVLRRHREEFLMNDRRLPNPLLFLAAVFGLISISGCPGPEAKKDAFIAEMIKGGLSARSSLLNSAGSVFSDYKVYRDGDKDGVVFEYIFAADTIIDRAKLAPDFVKGEMISRLSADPKSREAVSKGVYVRFLYKSFDGEVICDVTIKPEDL
jgi:hypothetical protein